MSSRFPYCSVMVQHQSVRPPDLAVRACGRRGPRADFRVVEGVSLPPPGGGAGAQRVQPLPVEVQLDDDDALKAVMMMRTSQPSLVVDLARTPKKRSQPCGQ